MEIKITDKHLYDVVADAYAVFYDDTFTFDEQLRNLSTRFYAPLEAVLKQRKFTGAAGSMVTVMGADGQRPVVLMIVGLGAITRGQADRLEQCRRAAGQVIRAAEQCKSTSIALTFPDSRWFASDDYTVAKNIVSTMAMATYHFDQYITDESRKHNQKYEITLCAPALVHEKILVGVEHGQRIGYAVNQARHWCDLPACVMTPIHMAEHAERIARTHDLKLTVFNEAEVIQKGMGGLASVSKGSIEECRFIVLEYHTEHANAQTVAIVGKGITFDSGGISIKPSARMDEMKDDMAGAAAVISAMEMVAHLKPRVNVIAVAPLSENMPSGNATRPGDVVQFYNGTTAEIKNTDAEGRLVLADALSYAVKHYAPDAIIDFATLTGSCAYALGPFFAGLMSQHEELAQRVLSAGQRSGDRVWPLPFHDDYKPAVRSTVADLCNEGSATYRAGAITAGFFLQSFVGTVPWVHLDIAGTSFNVPDMSYYRPGATGFGVRLLADLLLHWQ